MARYRPRCHRSARRPRHLSPEQRTSRSRRRGRRRRGRGQHGCTGIARTARRAQRTADGCRQLRTRRRDDRDPKTSRQRGGDRRDVRPTADRNHRRQIGVTNSVARQGFFQDSHEVVERIADRVVKFVPGEPDIAVRPRATRRRAWSPCSTRAAPWRFGSRSAAGLSEPIAEVPDGSNEPVLGKSAMTEANSA